MVTPLQSIRDLALQPRRSSYFYLTRISKFDEDFKLRNFQRYSSLLTDYLIRSFRVTKTANKDSTIGVFRELRSRDHEEDIEGELGLCCVIEARVAPDHAKIDGQLGPRTSICDVVLCLGHPIQAADGGGFKFAFGLTRGKDGVIKAVLDFVKTTFGADTTPAKIAPYHLMFLAREWTRDLDEKQQEEEEEELIREEGRKFKRLARLEMVFTMPSSSSNPTISTTTKEVESIHITVEEESLKSLHTLVEKGENQDHDFKSRKDPALVSALAKHITKHLNVDLTGAGVSMIVTPTAELSSDGKLRFLWPAHLKRALIHLKEVSKARAEQIEL